jgi:hypothetical protein
MQTLDDVVDRIPPGCGVIGLLSGDEFLPGVEEFDRALIGMTGPRVALLFCADSRAAPHSARLAVAHYRRLGAAPIPLDVLTREQAAADALPPYDVLFLAGGGPHALLECVQDTPLWDEALRRWRAGTALAGASAGAMTLSIHCSVPDEGASAPTRWTRGLGPLERFGLACHATSRPRGWLEDLCAKAPVPVVALDDHTGMILGPGVPPAVHGPGRAWVAP